MQNAQEIFDRIQETKRKIKDIRTFLKSKYKEVSEYVEIQDKKKTLNQKQKLITMEVDSHYPDEITKLEDMKIDLDSDKEMLNDILLTKLMKGEDVELKNNPNRDQMMLPIFAVKLVKKD